jgi:hypothetical protein
VSTTQAEQPPYGYTHLPLGPIGTTRYDLANWWRWRTERNGTPSPHPRDNGVDLALRDTLAPYEVGWLVALYPHNPHGPGNAWLGATGTYPRAAWAHLAGNACGERRPQDYNARRPDLVSCPRCKPRVKGRRR